jgi:hypothetical protein
MGVKAVLYFDTFDLSLLASMRVKHIKAASSVGIYPVIKTEKRPSLQISL